MNRRGESRNTLPGRSISSDLEDETLQQSIEALERVCRRRLTEFLDVLTPSGHHRLERFVKFRFDHPHRIEDVANPGLKYVTDEDVDHIRFVLRVCLQE